MDISISSTKMWIVSVALSTLPGICLAVNESKKASPERDDPRIFAQEFIGKMISTATVMAIDTEKKTTKVLVRHTSGLNCNVLLTHETNEWKVLEVQCETVKSKPKDTGSTVLW